MSERGYWFTTMEGERIWCASPERERCGGHGYMHCYCGGDFCCCGNQGEIECMGCPDCDRDDDEWYPEDEDERMTMEEALAADDKKLRAMGAYDSPASPTPRAVQPPSGGDDNG